MVKLRFLFFLDWFIPRVTNILNVLDEIAALKVKHYCLFALLVLPSQFLESFLQTDQVVVVQVYIRLGL